MAGRRSKPGVKELVPDASFYRNRARDCRDLAQLIIDERGGTGLLELARTYDWQAECLEMTTTLLDRNRTANPHFENKRAGTRH